MKMKLSLILTLLTLTTSAFAEWELQFDKAQLVDNGNNRSIIKRLRALLPNYQDNHNPILQFTFHHKAHSQSRWKNLVEQVPELKNYYFQIYHSPNSDALSIDFRHLTNEKCPTVITLYDEALPIGQSGLRITHSAQLAISEQAVIHINNKKQLSALSYDSNTQEMHALKLDEPLQPTISSQGITIGLILSKEEQTLAELKHDMQNAVKAHEYSKKGMSLSPIPIETINTSNTQQVIKMCTIKITPLRTQ